MKFLLKLLLALGLAFCAPPARAMLINGQTYTPLAEWARGNGFSGFTRDHGKEIILTNRTMRLAFDVDSAQAEINAVNVRLSFPVANVKGAPLIAQFDQDQTLRPLHYPAR